jgi:hypothetical protein
MTNPRTILPAPEFLVRNGEPQFGVFAAPPRNANIMDARYELRPGLPAPPAVKALRLKQWQFYLFTHPRLALGMVIIDLGFCASSFLYVFDRGANKLWPRKRLTLDRGVKLAENLWDGRCVFKQKNYSIEIRNRLEQGTHRIALDLQGGGPRVSGELTVHQNPGGTRPVSVCMPVRPGRFMYSTKQAGTVSGTLSLDGEQIIFDPARDTAFMDEHKAFYPRHTYWKWASLAFVDAAGRLVAANMTDNLVKDQHAWNENAILTPDATDLLGPMRFEYDRADVMKPWRIRDLEGRVQLDFTPMAVKTDDTNAVLIRTDYRQPMGLFNGTLTTSAGEAIAVKDAFGVTEHFDAHY